MDFRSLSLNPKILVVNISNLIRKKAFESEIILFEATAREIKKVGLTKLSSEKLKAKLDELTAHKNILQAERWKIQ